MGTKEEKSWNTLILINEVTLCQASLLVGWVTVCREVNYLSM